MAVTVSPGSTLLDISPAQPPPITVGAHVTYTATVTKTSGSGALSGVISFSGKGGTVQGCSNLPVSAGKASCTITFETQGTFTVKAVYTGDPYFTSSSDFVTQSVSSSGAPTFTSPSSDTATAGTIVRLRRHHVGHACAGDHRDRRAAQRAAASPTTGTAPPPSRAHSPQSRVVRTH